ncbi:hypothetical protein PHYBOEH_009164 [Phytophthora boehmeriae]|uniref:E3 ubiquitin-protein ligase HACE1 n=1 Tax=Phytophthora boehmeriae TaxID=109152 RepID=A0A8T1VZ02_9STRA|nr:hypothetical protein PHYBOEH_009164 [Phytophthora boehmeriae]
MTPPPTPSRRPRPRHKPKPRASSAPEPSALQQLVSAIRHNDQTAFDALLETPNLDVNRRSTLGDVLLVEACRFARLEMAAALIQRQANVNLTSANRSANRDGLSPLIAACMALHSTLVKRLLSAEKKVDLLQNFGRVNAATVCLLFCTANGRTEEQNDRALEILEKVLRYAKQQGQLDKLLDAKPDKVNGLVHIAAGLGNWKALQFLRRHAEEFGVNFQARNAMNHSLLLAVEMNSFHARSPQFCEPPRLGTETVRGQGRGRKDRKSRKKREQKKKTDKEETQENVKEEEELEELPSEADKQTFTRSRPDRSVEATHVTRTVMELVKSTGVGAIFSRKGDEGVRGLFIKTLVLAEVGIVPILNEIAQMSDSQKEKAVYMDGVMYSVAAVYPLSVRNAKEYQGLWRQALNKQSYPDVSPSLSGQGDEEEKKRVPVVHQQAPELSHEAFKMILSGMLSYSSLSKRVKVWTLVLMHLLAPYSDGSPLSVDQLPTMEECGQLQFFERITKMLYRSGTKLAFCIFDRTDIEDDESYDEEIEFHLLIALFELFLQFFVPYARTIRGGENAEALGIAESFRRSIQPVKQLWSLVSAALSSLDDAIATPQRFSLLLHLLQVFEQLEAAFVADEEATLTKLFAITKRFVEQEAKKKRIKMFVSEHTNLLHRIATSFPMPAAFTDKMQSLKDSVDMLIRSDPKVLGMDLYAFASIPGLIRIEHKVDYLAMLAEERNGSVAVSISRASGADYVDFILQQILSATANNLKGEINITLINEPGVGVGVTREFFQIVQKCFFHPDSSRSLRMRSPSTQPSLHVREIGSNWLQLARSQSPTRNGNSGKKRPDNDRSGRGKRNRQARDGSFAELFPLFDFVDKQKPGVLGISPRPLYVSKQVIDTKRSQEDLSLSQKDVLVDTGEVDALKKVYLCIGRLIGLAIRNHQPLAADFPLVFWRFMLRDNTLSWEDYCENSDVFKGSLRFVLEHDFDVEPLDMRFEYTVDVVIVDDEVGEGSEGTKGKDQSEVQAESTAPSKSATTVSMELELKSGMGDVEVTNANKAQYVLLRAQQYFFGNELDYYKKLRDGFQDTITRSDLKLFHPSELRRLVRGERTIDFEGLKKSVLYSRGASPSRGVIQRFWEVAESFDQETRAKLLTFWSGSPLPPIFGFDSKYRSMNADTACWYIDVDSRMQLTHCPMANTCDRRLILPDYPTSAALEEKLLIALKHGCVGYDRM